MSEAKLARDTEHALQKFAPLLDANPRSMKRCVNACSVTGAVRPLEGNVIATDTLARWVIVRARWPQLAEYLQANPAAIDLFVKREAEGLPDGIDQLARSPEVAHVLGKDTSIMSDDDIRACCGENGMNSAHSLDA